VHDAGGVKSGLAHFFYFQFSSMGNKHVVTAR